MLEMIERTVKYTLFVALALIVLAQFGDDVRSRMEAVADALFGTNVCACVK